MIRRLLSRPTGVFAVVVLGLLVVLAAVSLVWTPQDPFRADPFHQWEARAPRTGSAPTPPVATSRATCSPAPAPPCSSPSGPG
ncbi:hypothetical protein QP157_12735 [Sphingomonas sp. LR61]|uniref:hypothetical protein n=1 Tax=Sphingomonas sp. LR61 TaxID=3050234 RepID=UPI002FE0A9B6